MPVDAATPTALAVGKPANLASNPAPLVTAPTNVTSLWRMEPCLALHIVIKAWVLVSCALELDVIFISFVTSFSFTE